MLNLLFIVLLMGKQSSFLIQFPFVVQYKDKIMPLTICNLSSHNFMLISIFYIIFSQHSERSKVLLQHGVVTSWLAPIVWEGTFDSAVIDGIYKPLNVTIATTVFAVGKYITYLKDFLESAEKHYMVGYNINYYIFTDQPENIPAVTLAAGRSLWSLRVPAFNRWQEISLQRMSFIRKAIEEQIRKEASFIFCLDVDMRFDNHWGAEALGNLVAVIHPWFYQASRDSFPYERRPESLAYVHADEGDFYYGGAVFGGLIDEVYKLTGTCEEHLVIDKGKDIEAVWQEESHLNWYFIYNKPTKLLSMEYLWSDEKVKITELKVVRLSTIKKNLAAVRPN
uniref:Globoside alpha-1,3-N-acetylgalactosaminyltransferase 1 n=1 Tax=Denticeps clupeoides TaxID=299321 RepID=A0AAY4CK76_9TELE